MKGTSSSPLAPYNYRTAQMTFQLPKDKKKRGSYPHQMGFLGYYPMLCGLVQP
jgi:hypothetical protein